MHILLVLGGYGFFGRRICQALAAEPGIYLIIAGRDGGKARQLADELGLKAAQAVALDAHAPGLAASLAQWGVNTVLHTAGPFQGQDYAVARAAIDAGANYIDLSDGREFVAGIDQLDVLARAKGVCVTSGASSLPALSSAVVDRYAGRFGRMTSIRHGIGSGARSPGLATMRGVFGYCGKPFTRLEAGRWRAVYGWLDLSLHTFPKPVGKRWLGNLDVPDLALFPKRYPAVQSVIFQAGFAGAPGHLFLWAASWVTRIGLLPGLAALAGPLHKVSGWLEPLISDKGGMFVDMEGMGLDGKPLRVVWNLVAARNHGPYIPCGASIALARRLAQGEALPPGAFPCMGLVNVDEYLAALDGFDIRELPA